MLFLLSIIVGIGTGLAAVLLKTAIHEVSSFINETSLQIGTKYLTLIIPGVGILISLLILKFFVKDNISHGVTRVLFAISRHESRIKSHNIWSSMLTSSLTIGFGGSVGAEAPIVLTGASIGSKIGQKMGLSYKQVTILIGCGAAGAVAGIFKAPLAGVLFTLEILLLNISMTSILPILTSAITSTVISYYFLGNTVVLENSLVPFKFTNLVYYVILGIFTGILALYFIRVTLLTEERLNSIKKSYIKWIISAVGLGILVTLFPPLFGEGYTYLSDLLNNKESIQLDFLSSSKLSIWAIPLFFLSVMLLKIIAMSLTNAGGGVGGTFGPTLFMGGIAGFLLARTFNNFGLTTLPEANFVLAGMAGLMSGVMFAPLTAIFLIAEITGGYQLLIPLIVTSLISFLTIKMFENYSIYTKRIAHQGDLLTHDSDHSVLTLLKTENLLEEDFISVDIDSNLEGLVDIISKSKRNIFPVINSNNILEGVILLENVRGIMFNRDLYKKVSIKQIMIVPPSTIQINESMKSVMDKFDLTGAWNLPVISKEGKYLGFVSKSKIFTSYRNQLQQVSHE